MEKAIAASHSQASPVAASAPPQTPPFFPPPVPWPSAYNLPPYPQYPYYSYYSYPNYPFYGPPSWGSGRFPPPFFPPTLAVGPPSGHSQTTSKNSVPIAPIPSPPPPSPLPPPSPVSLPTSNASPSVASNVPGMPPPLSIAPGKLQSAICNPFPSTRRPSRPVEKSHKCRKQENHESADFRATATFRREAEITADCSPPVDSTVSPPQSPCLSRVDPEIQSPISAASAPPPNFENSSQLRPPFPPLPFFLPQMPAPYVPPPNQFWGRAPYSPHPCSHCWPWGYNYYPPPLGLPPFPPFAPPPFSPCKWGIGTTPKKIGEEDDGQGIQSDNCHGSADGGPPQVSYERDEEVEDHDNGEEAHQFVVSDEWAKFFPQPEARRRDKKRQHKRELKAARKAAKTTLCVTP